MSIASCVRRAAGADAQQQMSRCVTLTADAYLWQTYLPFRENPPNIPPSDTRSCFKAEHAYSPSTNGGRRVPPWTFPLGHFPLPFWTSRTSPCAWRPFCTVCRQNAAYTYRVGQKRGRRLMALILSNLNRFTILFTDIKHHTAPCIYCYTTL